MSDDPDVTPEAVSGDTPSLPIPETPQKNELCTLRLRRFLRRHFLVFDFFFFGLHLAARADETRMTAAKALAAGGREQDVERLAEFEQNPDPAQKKLFSFSNLQVENIVIRIVDNFLSYLAEIIQDAITKRPQILMTEETIKVSDVLRFSRYSDLIAHLVEKKINDLSYSSIKDIERFVRKRTGLTMFDNDEERTLLVLAIELRNIYTHNRGVVSETTVRRLAGLDHDWTLEKGKHYGPGYDRIVLLANNLTNIARRLDDAFARKFHIRRKRYAAYET